MSDFEALRRNLRVLARTDLIIAEIWARHLAARTVLMLLAGLVASFGFVMLGVAGFLALQEAYGAIVAATVCGAGAVFLALVLALVAVSMKPGRELDAASEVHQAAMAALGDEVSTAGGTVARLAAIARNPVDTVLPGLLVPLLTFVIGLFRRRRGGAS